MPLDPLPAEPRYAEASGMENSVSSRRSVIKGFAMFGGGIALVQPIDVMAMMQTAEKSAEDAVVQQLSEHARATSLPKEAHALPRWKPEFTGPYDLSRPLDNHHAFAKVQANLAGEYSWLAQYGWVMLAPPGQPAFPWLGKVTLVQLFVTPASEEITPGEELSEHDYVLWGTFNQVYVDPRTMAPLDRVLNPYTGKTIDVPSVDYADRLTMRLGRRLIVPGVDPKFYDQPWDRDGGYSQHFIDTGNEIAYTVLGASQQPGPHQPRVDVAHWTSTRDDIMDPAKRSIDCKRDYTSVMYAAEYPWMGVERGDPTQIITHLSGLKTQNVARLPDFIKPLVLDRFKGRYVI
ncbi:hypothetical protein [Altererythrobacter sp. GH1-8]|uniref:hypothetical protein n=1 Tax=Altererythrobacter sp. GH1-8 TaxID=3349333 RepID=UPI00374D8038